MEFVRSFQTLWAIMKREFSLYFISPLFYLLGGVFLFVTGVFFMVSLAAINQGWRDPDLNSMLGSTSILMLFFAPLLTMRLVAEEAHQGTLELLLTRPVRDWQVVVGKFLASWGVVTFLLLITTIYAFILTWRGEPDQPVILSGYLGLWLVAGTMLSIGVLMSSLTQYQLVAGALTLGALVMLWVAEATTGLVETFSRGTQGTFRTIVGDTVSNLAIYNHYHPTLLRGILNITDIVYYVFLMALSLFLATRVLEARRWRA